jgi:hypothetical protein
MKNAAVARSSGKLSYNAKPKLKVWTTETKSALKINMPLLFVTCDFNPLFLKMGVRSPTFSVSGTFPCLKISFPINSALPVAECYREVVENNAEGQVILLDAKAAVQLVLMFPILIPIFADSSLASNGLM